MSNENKLQGVITASMEQLKDLIDANTVIGNPITTGTGTTIIPISKVAVGYATGGVDFNDKNASSAPRAQNFGAGGGTGISIQPVGFLCISADGKIEMVNVGLKNPMDPIEQISEILERSPEIIAKIKDIFAKDEE